MVYFAKILFYIRPTLEEEMVFHEWISRPIAKSERWSLSEVLS